jgi:flagellar biosynthesis component FlhA
LLLREGAWPRDPIAVLEAMLEAGTRDAGELAEAARRAIVPALLRRRGVAQLEPLIFDPDFERKLVTAWCRYGADAAEPATALTIRARIEAYAARTPRDRAAVVCTAALRAALADFLLRCGIRLGVYAYGELPNELVLAPAEVIAEAEPNALVPCT